MQPPAARHAERPLSTRGPERLARVPRAVDHSVAEMPNGAYILRLYTGLTHPTSVDRCRRLSSAPTGRAPKRKQQRPATTAFLPDPNFPAARSCIPTSTRFEAPQRGRR